MTIYDFITEQVNAYAMPITLEEGWDWSMKDHLRRSFLYLNSQFEDQNEDRTLRPNKNIVLAIMNVQYRTEGFDVKDIELYVDNPDLYYRSTLSRKFHDKWALENGMDEAIDDSVVSYCTYGGVLMRNKGESKPSVVQLRTLAFCNQKDILSSPFGIKHGMSQAELRAMEEFGWGDEKNGATISIEELIVLAKKEGSDEIELTEVYGVMPKEWLNDNTAEADDESEDVMQMQVIGEYQDQDKNLVGVTLFSAKVPNLDKIFKYLKRDKVEERAVGRGGVEELFESQIWTNWNEIKITEMLDSASKTLLLTDDPAIASKHKSGLKDMDNLEIIETVSGGKGLWQMDTFPRSVEKFNASVEAWQTQAQIVGSASENLLGEKPSAGTPFKLFEAQTIEDKSLHRYRQGQIAAFWDDIYRDWILPHINKEIVKDQTFLQEFSADEMIEIAEQVSKNFANRKLVEKVLNGETIAPGEKEQIIEETRQEFLQGGNKKFVEMLKQDFKNVPLAVKTNIAGKQKNLALMTDKIVNLVKQYIGTPQLRNDPEMAKLMNEVIESSGMSPIMFGASPAPQLPPQAGGGTAPLEALSQANQPQA